ncbi:single-stranded DNA-binding protein [Streptomyces scabiei]|uniref:single-stranded DNA-binding protein n=1 Tax=Streptomyces scabiei TaxID=1930 RepID=UPI001B34318F|nr:MULTISPECIES: single-stranded DNA-binding protein [Streptomyces]MBP5896372.1 single-stranded DNA-binding protein [Streptomyces sp. LBUM 1481]MDX3298606.1 single-stranded DNA-binding protein [Streptomyces scabiei]
MAGDTLITLVGNLVDDPELRFTPSGVAVAKFRVASTPRVFDRQSNEWKDGESLFLTCSVWRQVAENVAESLQRGMRVIIQGRLKQRSYEDREGVKRTVFELDVEEVGPSLLRATARVEKTRRNNEGYGNPSAAASPAANTGWNGGGQQQAGEDPWATPAPAPTGGGWNAQPAGYTDEPPF